MKKKAQVTMYIYFMFMAIIIIVIAAVFAPMGVLFNTKMYEAGEGILLDANDSIADINDATVRARVYAVVNSAYDAGENNIEVNANIFQYSWIIILVLTGIVVYLQTRRLVEVGAGGFI